MNETLPTTEPPAPHGHRDRARKMQFRIAALVGILIVAGVVIWLAVGKDDSSSSSVDTSAVEITPAGLTTLAAALKQPIYWVGPMNDVRYELNRPPNGRILLGYLPSSLDIGDTTPHLTVGTYPVQDAYAV